MPLTQQQIADAGPYVGYTLGGKEPTLYFERGHLTQVHDISSNIGFHDDPAGSIIYRENRTSKDGSTVRLYEYYLDPNKKEVMYHESRSKLVKLGDADFKKFDEAYASKALRNASVSLLDLGTARQRNMLLELDAQGTATLQKVIDMHQEARKPRDAGERGRSNAISLDNKEAELFRTLLTS
jgi:hypothetical protein